MGRSTPAGAAQLAQINSMVDAQRNPAGVLPNNFFAVPLPANFWGTQATQYDITSLQGYKMFRLRQVYNTGFGDLYVPSQPRFIQFGIKVFF